MEEKNIYEAVKEAIEVIDNTEHMPADPWEMETKDIQNFCCRVAGSFRYSKNFNICVPSLFVPETRGAIGNDGARQKNICATIAFPYGTSNTASKIAEAVQAVKDGADEVDIMISASMIKSERYSDIMDEIKAVQKAVANAEEKQRPFPVETGVIIETSSISEKQLKKMCTLCALSGTDYFVAFETPSHREMEYQVETMRAVRKYIVAANNEFSASIKIKAMGEIVEFETAKNLLDAGADKICSDSLLYSFEELIHTSRLAQEIYKNLETFGDDGPYIFSTPVKMWDLEKEAMRYQEFPLEILSNGSFLPILCRRKMSPHIPLILIGIMDDLMEGNKGKLKIFKIFGADMINGTGKKSELYREIKAWAKNHKIQVEGYCLSNLLK